jgi:D-alanyl-D-alanine dipeptidase
VKTAAVIAALALATLATRAGADPALPVDPPSGLPPPGFVDLAQIAPAIVVQMRYAGAQNFVGRPVHGYAAAHCWLSRPAALALAGVAQDLAGRGLGLMVYDCYRPQRAVDDFVAWAKERDDDGDPAARKRHYPAVPKAELFHRGYIALRSGHTRGSTVDLTLIAPSRMPDAGAAFEEPDDCRVGNGTPTAADGSLEMGTAFDCFDERAHADHAGIAPEARHNRQLLRQAMLRRGFSPYAKEWWHFTLTAEPFPDRYFDFEVR